jgi:peptidyl-prolyl cis-trans isomerase B (cyclophilin B)
MKKWFLMILALTVALTMALAGCGDKAKSGSPADSTTKAGTEESSAGSGDAAAGSSAVIRVKDFGDITVELDAQQAPKTVANFVKLAKAGFYDGLTFHRIIPGFMIQGGDPTGVGNGGSDKTIKGEFSENGVENTISHVRGVISMARKDPMDSASSQFFITNADSAYLDGKYAAFGRVTSGMDVVDKISAVPTGEADRPDTPVVIESITIQ